jgi:hypothetical protein
MLPETAGMFLSHRSARAKARSHQATGLLPSQRWGRLGRYQCSIQLEINLQHGQSQFAAKRTMDEKIMT